MQFDQRALRLAVGLRRRMRRTEGGILRPITSRNIRSTGVSRCAFSGMNPLSRRTTNRTPQWQDARNVTARHFNLSRVLRLAQPWHLRPCTCARQVGREALLCVGNSLHGFHGNFELKIARSADSSCGNLTEPFEHPKIAFLHAPSFPTGWRDVSFIAQTQVRHSIHNMS